MKRLWTDFASPELAAPRTHAVSSTPQQRVPPLASKKNKKKRKLDPKLQAWIAARKRHHLSDAHVQMARELGMNPAKLGKIDNHQQEPWKAPLPVFIESLYEKRFGRRRPGTVVSIEELARMRAEKQEANRQAQMEQRASQVASDAAGDTTIKSDAAGEDDRG